MINNEKNKIVVSVAGSSDTINNYGAEVTITGGDGTDSIRNYGAQSIINAGAGSDIVRNSGAQSSVDGGAGADVMYNSISTVSGNRVSGEYSTLKGGAGNDSIINLVEHSVIDGGDDADLINNYGAYSQILGGAGADNIINTVGTSGGEAVSGNYSTIDGGAGNDYIENVAANVSINAGAGQNTVINDAGGINSTIVGGTGVDSIKNYADSVTIQSGASNDIVYNEGASVLIDGGAGNDSITTKGGNVTVNTGEGDDFVDNYADNVTIDGGDGYNQLISSGLNSSVKGGADKDFIRNYGDYSTVDAGDGNNVIFDGSTSVNGGQGTARGRYSFIKTGSGTDSILTDADHVTIDSGAGNDTVEVKRGDFDFSTDYNSISAGDGNDRINVLTGYGSTINAGAGNDTVSISGATVAIEYASGDGNDIIYGVDNSTTLKLNGVAYGGQTIGSGSASVDVILTVGSNKVTLKSAAGKSLNLINSDGTQVKLALGSQTLNSASDSESIIGTQFNDTININNNNVRVNAGLGNDRVQINKVNAVSIDGGAGADSIENVGGSDNTLIGGAGADSIYVLNTTEYNVYSGEMTMLYASNNVVDGGADADYIKNEGENSTLSGGAGNDTIELTGNGSATINYKSGAGSDVIITNFDFLQELSAFENPWQPGDSGTYYDEETGEEESWDSVSWDAESYVRQLREKNTFKITGTSFSAYTLGSGSSDDDLNFYLKSGSDIITVKEGSHDDSERGIIIDANGNVILHDFKGADFHSAMFELCGYDLWNYSSYSSLNDWNPYSEYNLDWDKIRISNHLFINARDNAVINFGNYNAYTLSNLGSYVKLIGSDGNDEIYNTGEHATVVGGAGDDNISLLSSGNVIEYAAGDGNDTIFGYYDNDTIRLTSGSISGSSVNGNDMILNIGSGSIRLTNAAAQKITVMDSTSKYYITNGKDGVKMESTEYNDTLENTASNVTIDGKAGDDFIRSSGENVSINPGAGDDTIELTGYGSSTIKYAAGDGNDVIIANFSKLNETDKEPYQSLEDYYASHTTALTGVALSSYTLGSASASDSLDVYFKSSSNIITLKKQPTDYSIFSVETDGSLKMFFVDGAYGLLLYEHELNLPYGDFFNNMSNATITAGKYNYYALKNFAASLKYIGGDGSDAVENYHQGTNATISTGVDNDAIYNEANGAKIDAGTGNDVIVNSALSNISGTLSVGSNVSINGGDGNDYIENSGNNVTVLGGAGNDTIQNGYDQINYWNEYVTTIKAVLDGGAGTDSIVSWSKNTTITGGADNDTIELHAGNNVIKYAAGDGNDVIIGYDETSTIQLTSGSLGGSSVDGNDIVLTVGTGSMRLKNTVGQKITVEDAAGNVTSKYYSSATINNTVGNTLISTDEYNDSIKNDAANVTISAGNGNDFISNQSGGGKVSIDAGADNDTINSASSNVTINAGDGNDYINTWGDTMTIDAGTGDDSVYNQSTYTMIKVGDGNDSVNNLTHHVTIDGGAGADTIINSSSNVTIVGGTGNDIVSLDTNASELVKYAVGDGNDTIYNFNDLDTLQLSGATIKGYTLGNGTASTDVLLDLGTSTLTFKDATGKWFNIVNAQGTLLHTILGAATINNTQASTLISSGIYNDRIINNASKVTISTGAGNDTIQNSVGGSLSAIFAGDGADSLINQAASVTIDGGAGNDYFDNSGSLSALDGGAGDDRITNSGSTVTINADGGNDSVDNSGASVRINLGDGDDYLNNEEEASLTAIYAGAGNDSIYNRSSNNVTVDAGGGNDSITNSLGFNLSISAGDGDDYVISMGRDVTIDGGNGNDWIRSRGVAAVVDGGAGNDTILNDADNASINAGAGDDSIYIQKYAVNSSISGGAGNDTITNEHTKNHLQGNAGNDFIIDTSHDNTILGGTDDDIISLGSEHSDDLIQYSAGDGNDIVYGFGANDSLKLTSGSISGSSVDGSDVILNIGSGSITFKNASGQKINVIDSAGKVTSRIYGSVIITNSASNTLIATDEYNDTITNSGSKVTIRSGAGDDSINSAGDSISIDAGAGDDYVLTADRFVTIDPGAGNDTIETTYPYVRESKLCNAFIHNVGDGNDLFIFNPQSTGSQWDNHCYAKLKHNGADVTGYTLGSSEAPSDVIMQLGSETLTFRSYFNSYTIAKWDDSGDIFNSYYYDEENYYYFDSYGYKNLSIHISEYGSHEVGSGGYNTIYGSSNNDTVWGTGYDLIYGGAGTDQIYAEHNATINGGAGDDTIGSGMMICLSKDELEDFDAKGYNAYHLIDGGDGNDHISHVGLSTINGGAGNDSIYGLKVYREDNYDSDTDISYGEEIFVAAYNLVDGGAGNDYFEGLSFSTIIGGTGNDTVKDEGNSLIKYASGDGNDVIVGYDETSTIQITSGSLSGSSVDGNDMILNIGSGSIRLKDGKNKKININGTSNHLAALTINNTVSGIRLDGSEYGDTITNSGDNVTISSDASADSINNSGTNVSINAGTGDDTIELTGNGSAIINYKSGDGNDVIIAKFDTLPDYEGDDGEAEWAYYESRNTFTLNGAAVSSYTLGSASATDSLSVSLKTGSNTITVKNRLNEAYDYRNYAVDANGNLSMTQLYASGEWISEPVGLWKGEFTNNKSNAVITSGKYNAFRTFNNAAGLKFIGGDGAENVQNLRSGTKSMLNLGAGGDFAINEADSVTIAGGAGDDSIHNYNDSNVSIDGGAGNDQIFNNGNNATILGGAGNDTIANGIFYWDEEEYENGWLGIVTTLKAVLDGGSGADSLVSWSNNTTITGGADNDTIDLRAGNNVIKYASGDGNDVIVGYDETSTIQLTSGSIGGSSLDGSDVILNIGSGSIRLKDGKNKKININGTANYPTPLTINSTVAGIKLDGSEFGDTITNSGSKVTVTSGAGADSIINSGSSVSINGGAGNDSIIGKASKMTVVAGDGADYVSLSSGASLSTIDLGAGADKMINAATQVTINAGADNDSISNSASNVSINAGAGNDTVTNSAANVTVNAVGGNNLLKNTADKVTIVGGTGNDTVEGKIAFYQYSGGNDVITSHSANDTLKLSNASLTSYNVSGSDVIMTVGAGTLKFNGANGHRFNIIDSKGNLLQTILGAATINNTVGNTLIASDRFDDRITNSGSKVTITSGAGNDSIINSASSVSINAGAGNDTVTNSAANVTVNATGGNNLLKNTADKVTIVGGTGNDTVEGKVAFYQYSGGNDVITSHSANDTLKLSNASLTSYNVSGSDVIMTVGAGTLKFNGANGHRFNIIDSKGNLLQTILGAATINNTVGNTLIASDRFDDWITNSGSKVTITSGAGNDSVISDSSNVSINGGAGDDWLHNTAGGINTTILGGDGNDWIHNSASTATLNGGKGNDTIQVDAIDGGSKNEYITYADGDGNDVIYMADGDETLKITSGTFSTPSISGNDIVVKIGSGSVTYKDAKSKRINILDANNKLTSKYYAAANVNNTVGNTSVATDEFNDTITNSGSKVTISAGAGNDHITNTGSNVTVIDDAGNDTLNRADVYQYAAGNDVITAYAAGDSIKLGGDSIKGWYVDGSDVVLQVGSGSIKVKNSTDKAISIVDSNNKLTSKIYDADSLSNSTANTIINGSANDDVFVNTATKVTLQANAGNDTITNSGSTVVLNGGDGADTIKNSASSVTIAGGKGNDTVTNTGSKVSIDGGTGNDYIVGGSSSTIAGSTGNDTISLGSRDVIQYSDGDGTDVLVGYNSDSTIRLIDGALDSETFSDKDVIFNVGSGKITVKDGLNKKITILDADNNLTSKYYGPRTVNNTVSNENITTEGYADSIVNSGSGVTISSGGGADTITNESGASLTAIDGGAGADTITNAATKVTINGGADNDSISNNGANVSINGGAGNDVLTNKGASVTMVGGDGADKITNESGASLTAIDGGAGADTITNAATKVTINGGAGNDVFTNKGASVTMVGGDGADKITNESGASLTALDGGAGADTITNAATKVTINGGADNDLISNTGASVSINGGAGNDFISNTGKNVTVGGGAGNDTINRADVYQYSAGNDVLTSYAVGDTIQLLNDSLTSYSVSGSDVVLKVGSGSITIKDAADKLFNIVDNKNKLIQKYVDVVIDNDKDSTVVSTNAGNDSITNSGTSVTIEGGAGNDTITNAATKVTINGGADNDSISNSGASVSINAGEGNDFINNSGKNVTVGGGAGNDTINRAAVYQYSAGNDVITAYAVGDTIQLLNDSLTSYSVSGSDVVLKVGSGSITIKDAADKLFNIVDNKNKLIQKYVDVVVDNAKDSTVVSTNAGNDSITNSGTSVTIEGGAGNDTITNAATKVTINGGADNDSISNSGASVSINGGAGNDFINNSGKNVTVGGGAGNDTINRADVYQYSAGKDVITAYAVGDTIQLLNDSLTSYSVSGSDVVLKVGSGSITIKDAADKLFNIVDNKNKLIQKYVDVVIDNAKDSTVVSTNAGNDSITNSGANVTILGGAGNDVIMNKGASVTMVGGDGADKITNESGASLTAIDGGAGADTISNAATKVTINGGADNDSISNNGASVSINAGEGNDFINNSGKNVTVGGGAGNDTINRAAVYQYSAGNDVITAYAVGDTIQLLNDSLTSYSVSGSDVVLKVGSGSITIKDAADKLFNIVDNKNKLIQKYVDVVIDNDKDSTVVSTNAGNDSITNSGTSVTIEGGAGNDSITNAATKVTINGGADNDSISNTGASVSINGGAGNDMLINKGASVTMVGGDGADKITNESGASLTAIDGGAGDDTITNAATKVTIDGGADNDSISNSGASVSSNGGSGNDVITNKGVSVTMVGGDGADKITNESSASLTAIDGGAGNDTISNAATKVTINGGADNDSISNNGASVSINAGDGNDFINNSGKNVTVRGGAGNDTINRADMYQYSAGKDVITAYTVGDTIQLVSDTLTSHSVSGSDVILKVGSGSITVKDASGKLLNVLDKNGKSTVQYFGAATINNSVSNVPINADDFNDQITNSASKVTINAGAGNDTIKNTGSTVIINAGDGNDSISNTGKNVTISGGAGNDTINRADRYQYTSGKDVITAYAVGDTIKLLNDSLTSYSVSGSDVILKVGSGSITVQNAAGKFFNIVDNKNKATKQYIGDVTIDNSTTGTLLATDEFNDRITNSGSKVTITSGAGNDSITNTGENVTINAGAGNNLISLGGTDAALIAFTADGNDTITSFGKNDTVRFVGSIQSRGKDGDNYTFQIKNGNKSGTVTFRDADAEDFSLKGSIIVRDVPNTINNTFDNASIIGTDIRDYIVNTGKNATIVPGNLNDTIVGSTHGQLYQMRSDGGDDVIINFGKNDTIQMTAGNTITFDTLGSDVIVTLKGANYAGTVTLKDAAQFNFKTSGKYFFVDPVHHLTNNNNNTIFSGTAELDEMLNTGEHVTVKPGKGNDTIIGSDFGEVFSFANNNGDNIITNFGENDSIHYSAGNIQALATVGNDVVVTLGTGTITLKDAAKNKINVVRNGKFATVDNINYVHNVDDRVTVKGSDGRDSITNEGEFVTIQAGKGADTITGSDYGEWFLFSSEHGNNVITNFGFNDSLKMTAGQTLSFATVGADVVVTLKGKSYTGYETLQGAAGLNIKKVGSNILVVDAINPIINDEPNTLISGTSDRDSIINYGEHVTIQPNAGNDTIEGSEHGEWFLFGAGDGDNVITNFGLNDSIRVTQGKIKSVTKSGNDHIVAFDGTNGGSITLLNTGDYKFIQNKTYLTAVPNIQTISSSRANSKLDGTDYSDVLVSKHQGVTLTGKGGDDTIYGSTFADFYVFNPDDGNDVITNFDDDDTLKIASGASITTLRSGDDVIFKVSRNKVTGSVTLKDVRGKAFAIEDNVVTVDYIHEILNRKDKVKITGTDKRDWITNYGENVTIQAGKGDDTITGSDEYGEWFLFSSEHDDNVITNFDMNDTLRMTAGKTMTWSTVGDDVIVTLQGSKYTGTVTLLDAAGMNFKKSGANLYVDGVPTISNDKDKVLVTGSKDAEFIINSGERVTINPGDGNDTITGSDEYGDLYLLASNYGDNVITNFGENDSIRITAGKFNSLAADGNDVLVTIKGSSFKGVTRLENAAGFIDQLVVKGSYITVDPGVPTVHSAKNNYKFVGTSNAEWMINSHQNVTIDGKGGGDTIEASNNPDWFLVSSAYGNGNVILDFGADDSIKCVGGSIQSIATVKGTNDVLVSLKGSAYNGDFLLKDAAGLNLVKSGKFITVDHGVPTLTNTKDDIKFSGSADAEYMINEGEGVTIEPKGGDDTITGSDYAEWYFLASNFGNNVITNFGVNDSIKITAGTLQKFATVGSDVVVTIKGAAFSATDTLKGAATLNIKQSGKILYADAVNTINNSADNKKVTGTDHRDLIINSGEGVTLQAGKGDDTIEGSNHAEVYLFSGGDGKDVITDFGVNDTLRMASGSIVSYAADGKDMLVKIKGAAGDGTVRLINAASNKFKTDSKKTWLVRDDGANEIVNSKDNVKVSGTDDADIIINSGDNVTIVSGGGTDTIYGSIFDEQFNFSSADGNNLVIGFDANDTVKCTAGKIQAVTKVGDDVVIDLKGNKYAGRVTLEGAGAIYGDMRWTSSVLTVDAVNYILNRKDKVKVVGTEGRDWITSTGEKVSIQPGKGDDTVTGSDMFGDVFLLSSDAGDNIITNFNYNDTLKSTAGTITGWTTVGDDMIVTIQGKSYKGVNTLLGAAGLDLKKSGSALVVDNVKVISNSKDKKLVEGSKGNDRIVNSGEFVTIQSGAGNDTVEGSDEFGEMYLFASNTDDNVVLNFRSNDTLRCTAGSISKFATVGSDVVVTLKGAAFSGTVTLKDAAGLNFKKNGAYLTVAGGVNTISNDANGKKVVGTDGADWIVNSGMNVSIEGKGGNDTIEGSSFGEMYLFSSAHGNNVITNFGANDSLKMTAGQSLTFATVGADVVVTLKGASYKGIETLKGAAGMNFKKSGSTLYVDVPSKIFNSDDNKKVVGTDKNDYITNVGQGVTIQSGAGNDTIEGSDFYGERFLFSHIEGNNVIVNFGENDTLQMTAGDSMTGAVKGDDYVVTIKGKSGTGTVTLKDVGSNNFAIKGDVLRTWNTTAATRAELAPAEDDYWFLDDETTAAPTNELDEMILAHDDDNALGKLTTSEDTLNAMMNVAAVPSIRNALENRRQH